MDRLRSLVGISIFWVALSLLGDGFAALVVPAQLARAADPAWVASVIGGVTFTGLVVGMLTQPLAGRLSDVLYPRWGRRGLLVAGAAGTIAALAIVAVADGIVPILAGFIALMIAVNVAQAAQQGFIPDQVEPSWRGRAAGAKGLGDLGGAFVGFLLFGAFLANGQLPTAIAIAAATVVALAVLTVALVREPGRRTGPSRREGAGGVLAAFRLDRSAHPTFVRLVAARFLFLLGTYAIGRFLLLFVADRLGTDPAAAAGAAGAILAALTLITAAAAIPAGWLADRWSGPATMVAGSVISAGAALLLIAAGSGAAILAVGALLAVGSAAFAAANWKLTTDAAPRDEAARFLGIANVGTAGAAAAAGLLGPVADLTRTVAPDLGYDAIFVAAALAFAASIAVAWPLLHRDVSPTVVSTQAITEAQRG